MPDPFLFYLLRQTKSLSRHKTKNAPLSGSIISLQRGRDSNPRYVAVYTLSKRAPSSTRPPLYKLIPQIHFNQTFWGFNNNFFIFSVHLFDEIVNHWDKNFRSI
jgi:hypothetical protein